MPQLASATKVSYDASYYMKHLRRVQRRSKLLLGCLGYSPHLLVSYLDLWPYCFYCGIRVNYATASIEHLTARSLHRGMVDKPKVLACYFCNRERGSTDLAKYLTSSRLVVSPKMAGFHFYRELPQNAFAYVGMAMPNLSGLPYRGHEFGLLY